MKKAISLLTAFCILNLTLGCSQSRILTVDNLKYQNKISEYVILHTPDKNYILDNYSFREQSLEGNLKKFKSKKGSFIHVYSTSGINIKLDEITSVPLTVAYKDIKEIKYKRTVIGKTFLLTAGIITGAILISVFVEILTGQPIWLHNISEN